MTTAEQLREINRTHGYQESVNGYRIAYHFFIGSDGSVVQTRSVRERSGHTRNQATNLSSISVALAGNFTHELPNERQLNALTTLIDDLRNIYGDLEVSGHRHESPTSCPGDQLDDWLKRKYSEGTFVSVSRYYTPLPNQEYYYRDSYEADFRINCQNDCFATASGIRLEDKTPGTVAACPKSFPFGTKLNIEGYGVVTCIDRGGAIISEQQCRDRGGTNCYDRIDIWMGAGTDALERIRSTKGGILRYTPA